jgi:hypothetical protein
VVSVFFTRARVASTTGALLFLGSFFGYFGVVSASGAVSPNAYASPPGFAHPRPSLCFESDVSFVVCACLTVRPVCSNKMAASVSATICFGLGATTIVKLESVGTGVTAEHASQRVDNFSYNDGAIMFFIDVCNSTPLCFVWLCVVCTLYRSPFLTHLRLWRLCVVRALYADCAVLRACDAQ